MGWNLPEQLVGSSSWRWTQSGSCSWIRRNRGGGGGGGGQLKRTQSGSSSQWSRGSCSRSGRNRGAVETDAIESSSWSGRKWRAAAEADANGEQQLKRIERQSRGEQQLKRTQSGSSSSAQRAVRRRITHVGEWGGYNWASEASEATCINNADMKSDPKYG